MSDEVKPFTTSPAPRPGALKLPEEKSVERPRYTIPEEFTREAGSFFNLDTARQLNPNVVQSVISLVGLNNRPGNVLRFASHPLDYLSGNYERNLLSAENPEQYASIPMLDITLMDENWQSAQTAVTLGTFGASTVFYGWNNSKNVDGLGRVLMLPYRHPATGKLRPGGYLANLFTTNILFLIGQGLAAQHRMLQDRDGMNTVSAYVAAASPYGWYLSFGGDEEHDFQSYMYADTAGGIPGDILQPIVARRASVSGATLYAGFHPDAILSHLNQAYLEARLDLTTLPQRLAAIETELQKPQGSLAAGTIDKLEQEKKTILARLGDLGKKGAIHWVPVESPQDVRRLALQAARNLGPASGPAVTQLETARNLALRITDVEKEAVRKLAGMSKTLQGIALQYSNGRWKVMWPRYITKATAFWIYNALNYHFVWGKDWKEAFLSGASVFVTVAGGEPAIQLLKTVYGMEKIPFFIEVIPTMGILVAAWSVNVWDRDVMLKRCQAERTNLIHSLSPEWREKGRRKIAEFYQYANEEERKLWALPVEEGGCGIMPEPKYDVR